MGKRGTFRSGLLLLFLLLATPAAAITLTDSLPPANDLLLAFGPRTVGSSINQILIITNEKNVPLSIGAIAGSDPLAPPYQIDSAACANRILAPGEVCSMTVTFAPAATGGFTDTFDISSNDAAAPLLVFSVSGSGTPVPVPDILVSDTLAPFDDLSLPFGERMVGTQFTQSVSISNVGNAPLVLGAIGSPNPPDSPFAISNDNCSGRTLAPNETCALALRFAPVAVGSFSAGFSIPSNDPDENPLSFNLSGIGTPVPVPDITLTLPAAPAGGLQIDFGSRILGSAQAETVVIGNTGTAPLHLGTIGAELAAAGPFQIQLDQCSGQSLTPGAECILTLAFTPTLVGPQSTILSIPSDDPDENPLPLILSGSGLAPALNHPPSAPALVAPSDRQTQVATDVTLVWTPSIDPDGQPVVYKVYWSTSPSFAGSTPMIVAPTPTASISGWLGSTVLLGLALPWFPSRRWRRSGWLLAALLAALLAGACGGLDPGDSPSGGVQQISADLAGLNPDTLYYWKVVSDDGQPGGTVESAVHSFRTR